MQTVRKKNVPSANWSKFLYIFYRHHFNFDTKMRFLCKEQKLVLWRQGLFFSLLCECVPRSYDATAAKSPLFEVNSIQFRGKENLICCRLFTSSKKKNPSCTNSWKELGRNCSPIGHNNTKHFCAQSEAGICLNFWNSSVRVGTQGLFCRYLKTFVPPFLPTRLTAPESPRMRKGPIIGILGAGLFKAGLR